MDFDQYLLVIWSFLGTVAVVKASENLASGKATNQSSILNGWGSSKAVDDCDLTFVNSGCCTHTAGGRKQAWWQVDLQKTSVIDSVQIIYRNEGILQRLAGYEIYLSDTPDWTSGTRCHKDDTPDLASMSATQNVQCQGVARYLTIYNDRRVKAKDWYSGDAYLELCEVIVKGCPFGQYGNGDCNNYCFNCLNNICNTSSGICDTCASGHYHSGEICTSCPANCAGNTCDKGSGACSGGCKTGFNGIYCRCPVNCRDTICGTDGHCTDCNDGYYGVLCTPCPSGCSGNMCDKTTGVCNAGCKTGFKGSYCRCPFNCRDISCGTNGHCTDCNDGYYGVLCTSCPSGCNGTMCDKTSGYCYGCDVGWHGNMCTQSCPNNCKNSVCIQTNGQCKAGCTAEFSGTHCRCPLNCRNTNCQTNGHCTDCKDGYYGQACTPCPSGCKSSTCYKSTGHCYDCKDGHYGPLCIPCPSRCSGSTCNTTSGHCFECDGGFHGNFCNKSCPASCINNICNISSGYCTGCISGYYGNTCDQACPSDCKNSECGQMSGECTECKPGLHGNMCDLTCPTNCKNDICGIQDGKCIETETLTNPTNSQAGAYAGAGVGVVVAIVVVIIVVIVVIRRRKLKSNEDAYKYPDTDDDLETTSSLPTSKSERKTRMAANNALPAASANQTEYINVCDVGRNEVVYSNMETSGGVSIDDIRAKLMQNKEEDFKNEFKELPWGAVHPHLEGTKPANKPKNRFKTTFPYDHSRVILDKIGNDTDSTYINANYLDSTDSRQAYVACQGPKEKTVDDFWRMVWQLNTGKIVMVTNLIEGGNVKCNQYWPDEGKPLSTRHFNVRLDRERMYAFYVLREISLTNKKTKEEHQVHQFHFTAWPDHGTPDTLELVLFHRRVLSYKTHLTGQMVVHCSAGLGRTGTFIGLDALLKEEKNSGKVDIPGYIRKMREDRMNMVQTHEQYTALHELLVEAHDLADTLISDTDFPASLRNMLPPGKPTNQTKLRKEFETLQTLIPNYDPSCYKTGMLKDNKSKNRTMTILAADKYRAFLRSQAGDRSDYINAVMLHSHRSKSGYLMTQFPLEGTIDDLWTMVIDYNCDNLVVLGTPTEHWLREESETKEAHEIYVSKQKVIDVISDVDIADYVITSKTSGVSMTTRIFAVKKWSSDSLLPPSNSSVLLLLEQLDSRRRSDNTRPVVVMCQDGCTQSGLFCCISNARDQMKMDGEVDIFQTSRQMLVRRPQALRHIEQYQYCYNFIGQYLDSTNIYIN